MKKYTACFTLLAVFVIIGVTVAGPKKHLRKAAKNLKESVLELREELEDLKAANAGVGRCGSNKIHFMFHGGHDDHTHAHDDDDVHVHVHLHDDHLDGDNHDHKHTATCKFGDGYDVSAFIVQDSSSKTANFQLSFGDLEVDGFKLHVHVNGDLTKGCTGLGPHYDPIEKDVDVGDLGSIAQEELVDGSIWINNTQLSLTGKYSILGRSIVLHNQDGDHLTCCVIGRGADDHGHDHDHGHDQDDHGHHKHH